MPVIDIQESLNAHDNVYSLFPFGLKFRGHFNGEGYRFIAEQMIERIQDNENK